MNFKYVELFAGIGGFRAALDKLGGECVLAAEWDKFARQSYTALYGDDHLHGDVTKINGNEVPDHDVMVFGMPCQAFSVAGKRLGFDDMRGTLYFEAMRIAKAKKPKVLWMENVKGLVGHDKGRTLEVMAQAMCDLGYTIDFDVLNSKYFGVPQNRERIFLIGVRDDLIELAPWVTGRRTDVVAKGKKRISALAGVKTFNFDWPTQEAVTIRLRDILEPVVDEKYYLSEEKTAALVAKLRDKETEILENRKDDDVNPIYTPDMVTKNQNGRRIKPADDVMPALTVQDRHGVVEGLPIREATKQGYAIANEGDAVNFQFPNSKTRRGRVGKQIAQTLEANAINQGVVTRQYRIRKLTPLETWRLQGFSDEAHETVKAAGISDSQRYKQAGNAVTINVIEAIGRKLLPLIDGKGGV